MRDYSRKNKKRASRNHRKKKGQTFDLKGFIKRCARLVVHVALLIGIGGTLYGGWEFFMTSPLFRLSSISIEGNHKVSREEILKAANIGSETNIFTCSISNIGRRIEEIAWVKEVLLERKLPDELQIKIVEREPMALINLGDFYYFDDEGYIFALADNNNGWDYPVINGIDKGSLLDGDQNTHALLEEGVRFVNSLKSGGAYINWKNISEVQLDEKEGITVYTMRDGLPVHLGKENLDLRIGRAERVLDDLEKKGIRAARVEADFDDRVLVGRTI